MKMTLLETGSERQRNGYGIHAIFSANRRVIYWFSSIVLLSNLQSGDITDGAMDERNESAK
jgi:hypothetical protein